MNDWRCAFPGYNSFYVAMYVSLSRRRYGAEVTGVEREMPCCSMIITTGAIYTVFEIECLGRKNCGARCIGPETALMCRSVVRSVGDCDPPSSQQLMFVAVMKISRFRLVN
jgi:hypothetical protein